MIFQTYYGCDMTFDSKRTDYEERFIIWPRRCIISGRLMYWEKVVRVTRHLRTDMDFYKEHLYVDPQEYLNIALQS